MFLRKKILIFILLFSISWRVGLTYAQTESKDFVNVKARVGQFTFSANGYISPYASIALIVEDKPLAATLSDSKGYFYISNIPINVDMTNFCFDVIDVKRIGESYTCMTIPPVNQNILLKNIFLPPTIGLQKKQVNIGDDAIIWGYTMPKASVKIYISNGDIYKTIASQDGYYEYHVKLAQSGDYSIYADALYQSKQSQNPNRKTELIVLSSNLTNIFGTSPKIINQYPIILLLIIFIPIIIFLVIFFRNYIKKYIDLFTSYFDRFVRKISKTKKLHHAWFIGY